MTEPSELDPDHRDQAVIDACLAGQKTRDLTWAEQRAVALALSARNFTRGAIALHLGIGENETGKLLRGQRKRGTPR